MCIYIIYNRGNVNKHEILELESLSEKNTRILSNLAEVVGEFTVMS